MDANTFVTALRQLEDDRDPEPLATLYADGAVSGNTSTTQTFDGPDGAREFWSGYRETFDEIRSTFRNVLQDGEVATLEWTSAATLGDGAEIEYQGVTVVEFSDGKITRSTAYFDPAPLTGGA